MPAGRPRRKPLSRCQVMAAVDVVDQAINPISMRALAINIQVDRRAVAAYIATNDLLTLEQVNRRPNGNPGGFAAVILTAKGLHEQLLKRTPHLRRGKATSKRKPLRAQNG